jgi:hypothetical protein
MMGLMRAVFRSGWDGGKHRRRGEIGSGGGEWEEEVGGRGSEGSETSGENGENG